MAGGRKKLKSAEILDVLSSLVDKSLVSVEETPKGQRYRFLETVREYLIETHGHNADAVKCRARHRNYFIEFANRSGPQLEGAGAGAAMELLEREHDNLRAAQESGLAENPTDSVRLTGSLRRFWLFGFWLEGVERARRALDAGVPCENHDRARAMECLATLYVRIGKLDDAEAAAIECLRLSRSLEDREVLAPCLNTLRNIFGERGKFAEAEFYYKECIEVGRQVENWRLVATATNNLGVTYLEQGEIDTAAEILEESLAVLKRAGLTAHSLPLVNVGCLHVDLGNYERAEELFREAVQIGEEVGDKPSLFLAFTNLGMLCREKPDLLESKTAFERALGIVEETGELDGAYGARMGLSLVLYEMGESEQAVLRNRQGMSSVAALGHDTATIEAMMIAGVIQSDPRLWGAAEKLRSKKGRALSGYYRRLFDRYSAPLRAQMGDEAFEAAIREGETMSVDEAVSLVLVH